MKLGERLKTLSKLNANSSFINKQLYRLLYNEDFYVLAYERLKRNKGAMTSGVNSKGNIDGINLDEIRKIISQLKDESYQPKPSRRVYIPKANGKQRPLGVPNFRDKLVQECINIILTCIYDSDVKPTFSDNSYGFRPGRGTHQALQRGSLIFKGVTWIIKADVEGFFDNVSHHILVELLERRIADKRFIRLIWKFLRCGYLDNGQLVKPKKGTPQGGNLSPILANIYLHEFDVFIDQLILKHGKSVTRNRRYKRKSDQIRRARQTLAKSNRSSDEHYAHKKARLEQLVQERRAMPSRIVDDKDKAEFKYLRYADDWVLGLKCNYQKAKEIYDLCEAFFQTQLHLEWNTDKSELTRSTKKDIEFLGVYLQFTGKRQVMYLKTKVGNQKSLKRTISLNDVRYVMKGEEVCEKLKKKGFLDASHDPISCKRLVNYDVYQIAKIYQSIINGIANYYGFVHNISTLNHLHYKLFISLCKTLAHKFKSSKRKIMRKYGGKVLTFKGLGNAKPIMITMCGGYRRDTRNFKVNSIKQDTLGLKLKVHTGITTSSWLKLKECCICGKEGYIEMHHVKSIKALGQKVKGFDKVMKRLNRKQIPVCLDCHWKIHKGLYDGLNLDQVADVVMKRLGMKKWEERNLSPI